MATAREAVEFVIRGRDEGTANLLKNLTQSTKLYHKTMQVAGADDALLNSLSRLGAEAVILARDLGSIAVSGGLDADIERTVEAHNKLTDVTQLNIAEIRRLKFQVGSLGKELSALKPKLTRTTAEIEGQRTALTAATAAQAANNKELDAAVANHANVIEKKRELKIQEQQLAKTAPASLANAENLRLVNEGINSTERFIARRKELAATAKQNQAARQAEQAAAQSAQDAEQATLDKAIAKLRTLGERQQKLINKQRELNEAQKNGAKNEKTRNNNAAKIKDIDDEILAQNKLIANSKILVAEATTETGKRAAATKASTAALDRENKELGEAKAALRALTEERKKLNAAAREGGYRKDDKARIETAQLIQQLEELETQLEQGIQRRMELKNTTDAAQASEKNKLTALIALQTKYKSLIQAIELNKKQASKDLGKEVGIGTNNLKKLQQYKADLKALEKAYADLAAQGHISKRATDKTVRGHRQAAVAVRQHARAQTALQAAMAKFYGNNRIQLSILQRMRTEVHGLLLQTAGVFAIYRGLQGVVEATKTVQKAENRLRSVVGDDAQLIGAELDFVRRNAKRLGIEFGILSNEYTKFSIATKNTNLEGANTRKIFTAVAEAARVNGADNEALSGTFLALTQIVSKGTVTMEELKRQLGDRLPGAVHIMADALGVTTAELFKMVEAGEVTSDALIKFADELDDRFGPALGKALRSTQTQIGRLQHELFQIQLRIAQSGFLESFNNLLATITETLGSSEFQSFADRMGGALSALADGLGFVIERWRGFVTLFSSFAIFKIIPIVTVLVSKMWSFATAIFGVNNAMGPVIPRTLRLTRGFRAMRIQMKATVGIVGKLRVAFLALQSSLGLIGVLLTGLAVVWAGVWTYSKTGADDANETLTTHQNLIDDIINKWDAAAGNVQKYHESLSDLDSFALRRNYGDVLQIALDELAQNNTLQKTKTTNSQFPGVPIGEDNAGANVITSFGTKGLPNVFQTPEAENYENYTRLNNERRNQLTQLLNAETSKADFLKAVQAYRELDLKTQTEFGVDKKSFIEKFPDLAAEIRANEKKFESDIVNILNVRNAELAIGIDDATADGNIYGASALTRRLTGQPLERFDTRKPIGESQDDITSIRGLNPDHKKDLELEKKLKAVTDIEEEAQRDIANSLKLFKENNADFVHESHPSSPIAGFIRESAENSARIKKEAADARAAIIRDHNKKNDKPEDPGKVLQDAAKDLIKALDSTEKQYDLTVPTVAFREHKSDPGLAALRDKFLQLAETDIPAAIQAVLDYYGALEKTPENLKIIEQWKQIQLEQQAALDKSNEIRVSWEQGAGILEGGFNSGIDTLAEELYETEKLFRSLEKAAKSFFSSFFIGIGRAIQEQLSFNAAKAVIGFIGGPIGILHSGGLAGADGGTSRNIPPIFEYHHTGGLAGLAANEVPAILERNEEVLTRSDPRHILNGGKGKVGGGSAPPVTLNNYNYSSMSEAWQAFLNSPEGEGFKNFFNNNGMEV